MSRPTNPAPWKHRKLHRSDTHGTGSVMWGHPNTSAERVVWAETVSCRKVSHACRAVAQFFGLSCSCLYAGMFHVRSRGSFGNVNAAWFSPFRWQYHRRLPRLPQPRSWKHWQREVHGQDGEYKNWSGVVATRKQSERDFSKWFSQNISYLGSFQGASRVGVNWGYESTGAGDAWYPGDLPRPWLPALHTWMRWRKKMRLEFKWDASMQRALDLFICFFTMERSGPASLSFGWDSLHQII